MLKIAYAGCLGQSPAISSRFTTEMCAAAKKCDKFNKTSLLSFGGSRSFKIIAVDKSKKPVTSHCGCHDIQQFCTYLQPFSHYTNQ